MNMQQILLQYGSPSFLSDGHLEPTQWMNTILCGSLPSLGLIT
jgi:hypothetical protein